MKKLVMVLVALSVALSVRVWAADTAAEAKKAKPVKQPKVVETRLSEHDMNKLEHAITKAVASKQGTGSWEYTAKKMKPPKNDKWTERWNEMGKDGWEAVDHFENVYIFKRPAIVGSTYMKAAPVEEQPKAESAEEMKKEDNAKEKAMKDADKEKEKAAKDAEKAAKKAEKEKEKAAKKAEKEAEKAAKKAEKDAKKAAEEAAKKSE